MTIDPASLLRLCFVLSLLLAMAGVGGMVLSALFMASTDMRDLVGAGFGFVAGAIFTGSGLISLTLSLSALHSKEQK